VLYDNVLFGLHASTFLKQPFLCNSVAFLVKFGL